MTYCGNNEAAILFDKFHLVFFKQRLQLNMITHGLDLYFAASREIKLRPIQWFDRLFGLFEGGWGSARKGQLRGRLLEDFVEAILNQVFSKDQIVPRCQFVGADGERSEKADFAIPNASDPHILIEAKAFNATGSKQTDVIGDILRIVEQKRDDTVFLLFTDGISWKARASDLKKIVELQNLGKIQKIYTMAMADELKADLISLKHTFQL